MTTTAPLAVPPPPVPSASAAVADGPAAEGPGHLRIDPRVVQKLAARAANEVDGVSRASAAPIGRAIRHPVPAGTPVDQLAIDLHLAVTVQYPLSLRVVVERLASHVSRRVEQLTGRPVRHVSVKVQGLGGHPVGGEQARVR